MYPLYLVGKNSVFMISLVKKGEKIQKYSNNENSYTNEVPVQLSQSWMLLPVDRLPSLFQH